MRELAPLIIFVYNRADVTEKMLEAINKNELTEDTEVYIFSDGSKNTEDKEKVDHVREIISRFRNSNNFKEVHIIEAEENKGLANSIISGVTEIIRRYGKVIVLEDDLITATNFLTFMNECLEFYRDNPKIWSIGGTSYLLPALEKYPHDVYTCYRGESWGWASWLDRWEKVDWDISDYEQFMHDRKRKKMFRRGGQDMVDALKRQREGKTDSWAIRWCYQQSKEDMLTILPSKSLVKNIGWGEAGTHCSDKEDIFHTSVEGEGYRFKLEDVQVNAGIMKDFRRYYSRPFLQRIMDWIYLKFIAR